jgi:acyl-CoA synthetase (AMP-forming)/AMP-acid ligase II
VPLGDTSEILVKGPHVMREYWGKPDITAATIVDGWLRTGDLGVMDDEGFIRIVDRSKDMLISGGDPATLIAAIEAEGEASLAKFKRPKHLVLVDDPLPRTFSGKVSKPVLRALFPDVPDRAQRLFAR